MDSPSASAAAAVSAQATAEMASMGIHQADNIKVAVRVRPQNERDAAVGQLDTAVQVAQVSAESLGDL